MGSSRAWTGTAINTLSIDLQSTPMSHSDRPRRASRTALWWILNLIAGLAAVVVCWSFGSTRGAFLVAAGFLVLGFAGGRTETLPFLAFRGWRRLTELSNYFASRWILTVLYGSLTVISLAGSRVELEESESLWTDLRDSSGLEPRGSLRPGRQLLDWARRSGNRWLIPLIPFFLLVKTFHARARTNEPPSNIYTLY